MIQLLPSVKWDKYSFNLECFSAKNITSLYLPRIVLHFLKRSTTLIYPIEKSHSFHCLSFWLENDMSSSNLSVKKYNVLLTFSHNVAGRQQKCVTRELCVSASNNKNPLVVKQIGKITNYSSNSEQWNKVPNFKPWCSCELILKTSPFSWHDFLNFQCHYRKSSFSLFLSCDFYSCIRVVMHDFERFTPTCFSATHLIFS